MRMPVNTATQYVFFIFIFNFNPNTFKKIILDFKIVPFKYIIIFFNVESCSTFTGIGGCVKRYTNT